MVSKESKGVRAGLLVATLFSLLSPLVSCKNGNPILPEKHPPVGNTNVSPVSGYAPLETRIKYDAEDIDGKETIINYEARIDIGDDGTTEEAISQSTPIDVTRTFSVPGIVGIYTTCTDSTNLTSEEDRVEINVLAPNNSPSVLMNVSPVSGTAPLQVRIPIDGDDPDGKEDIINYEARIDIGDDGTTEEAISQSTPIDVTRTFNIPGIVRIYGKTTDTGELADEKNVLVNVLAPNIPYLSQTAEMDNYVDIIYNATLSNLEKALLSAYRTGNSEPFFTEQIIAGSYSKTFSGMERGGYRFILESSETGLSDTDDVTIPNYAPEVDLSSVNIELNEEEQLTLNLPVPADKNPEDNPVRYTGVTSIDGKLNTSLNGYELTITGNTDKFGDCQLEFEFGNAANGTGTATKTGVIKNLVDILFKLENNEDDENTNYAGKIGELTIFDSTNAFAGTPLSIEQWLSRIIGTATSNNGNFSLQLAKPCSNAILQARIKDKSTPANQLSYVGSIELDGTRDYVSPILIARVVPYNGLAENGITPEQFRGHMREVNISTEPTSAENPAEEGLRKYDIHKIKIIKNNLGKGSFTDENISHMIDLLITNNITGYTEGRITSSNIEVDARENPDLSRLPDYIIVKRDLTIKDSLGNPLAGQTAGFGGTHVSGIVTGLLEVRINQLYDTVLLHEILGHGLTAPYDPPSPAAISGDKTFTDWDGSPTYVAFADDKRAKIVYEPLYFPKKTLSYLMNLGLLSEGAGEGYWLSK